MKMRTETNDSSRKIKPTLVALSSSVLALSFLSASGIVLADSQSDIARRAAAIQNIAQENNLQVTTNGIPAQSSGTSGGSQSDIARRAAAIQNIAQENNLQVTTNGIPAQSSGTSGTSGTSGGSSSTDNQLPKNVQSQTDESCNQGNVQKIAENISKENKNLLDAMVAAPANLAVASCLQNIMNVGVSFNISAFNPAALINQVIQSGVTAACNAANQLLQWPQNQLAGVINNNLSYSVPGIGQVVGGSVGLNNSGSFSSSVNGSNSGSVASPITGGVPMPQVSIPTLPSAPITNGASGTITPLKWN